MNKKFILRGLVFLLAAGAAGYLVLINPDNPFTRLFQRRITDIDSRIVIGPYPVERDFKKLAGAHVGLIVSLLDPAIPYEHTLLEKEKRLAAAYGMRLQNFPMASILGRKFGGYYLNSAADAAAAIAGTGDKVYLHCYLGLHRIMIVRDLLAAKGIGSERYALRQAEREKSRSLLDAADAAFQGRRYDEALAQLAQIMPEELSNDARLLSGWCHYQLGHYELAAAQFAEVRRTAPAVAAAAVGAGFCALRTNQNHQAETEFNEALRLAPDNADATGGLGLVRYRAGELAEATRLLQRAVELAPANQEFRDVLAQLTRK